MSTPRPVRWLIALTSLLALACGAGCASEGGPTPPGFEKVALRAEVTRSERGWVEGDLGVHTTRQGAGIGAAVGAPIGALLGMGVGTGLAFTCDGWEALACASAGILVGVFAGAAVGAATGAIIGGFGFDGLPVDTAKQVEAQLVRLEASGPFDDELLAALRAAVPQAKQAEGPDAQATVTARFDEFDLTQHRSERISVRLRASMVQTWRPPGGEPEQSLCEYRYTIEQKDAAAWLAADGGFRKAVDEGLWTMARWMARDLDAFARRTELPATASEPASCFREGRW